MRWHREHRPPAAGALAATAIAQRPRAHGRPSPPHGARIVATADCHPTPPSSVICTTAPNSALVLRRAATCGPRRPEAPTRGRRASAAARGRGHRGTGALEELHEIANGLHPAVLTKGGTAPGAEKPSPADPAVPVEPEPCGLGSGCPKPVEIAAYYAVSEALDQTRPSTRHGQRRRGRGGPPAATFLHVRVCDGRPPAAPASRGGFRASSASRTGSRRSAAASRCTAPPGGRQPVLEIDLPLGDPQRGGEGSRGSPAAG